MTIYPTIKTGGGNIEMAVETALGTAGTYYDFRVCEDTDPAFPTDTREVLPVSHKGHFDPSTREPQLSYEKFRESAISISTYAACSAITSADTDRPQFMRLLESMGCVIVSASATPTTIDTYTSTASFSLTADKSGVGEVGILELTNGTFWPTLTATYSGSATWNIVPSMAIPSASDAAKSFYQAWTITPPKGVQVSTARTLAFKVSDYYPTDTETGSQYVYLGCAGSEIEDVVFESGKPLKFGFKLHCADVAFDRSGVNLTGASYTDRVEIPIIDGSGDFRFGFSDATNGASGGEEEARTRGIRKAVWKPGIRTIPVLESGASTSVNGIGHYLGVYEGSTLELTMDVDYKYWDYLESSGSNTAKYIELIQPSTSMAKASLGLWMPQCYMVGKPTMDLWGDKEMTVTFTLEASNSLYDVTTKTAQGSAPWYFGISPYIAP
jgi:hypothetical protein